MLRLMKINPLVLVLIIAKIGSTTVTKINDSSLDESLQILTDKGIVQGRKGTTYYFKEYWAFQGIPYAKPPIGSLRFQGPKSAKPWEGVLDATKEGSTCVELLLRGANVSAIGTEDCLYLNVFVPQNPHTITEPLPVLVWIYGGAFIEGNSSSTIFGPDFLLQQDIILVTFNYRLGLFGFLSTEDPASLGNYGLKDQNLALRWVQTNIKNFGGDRTKVTIFGQSAGGASVFYHMASPKSKGLFHRGIANSGSSLCTFAYHRYARETAFQVGEAAGITTTDSKELISELRKIDAEKLKTVAATLVHLGAVRLNQFGHPFAPIIEPNHTDAFLTESSYTLFESGNFSKVPVLMGFNTLESIIFTNTIELIWPFISSVYNLSTGSFANPSMNIKSPQQRSQVGRMIKQHYFKSQTLSGATEDERLYYVSDDQFLRPVWKTAQLIYRYTPVYFYVFAYQSDYGIKGYDDEIKGLQKGVSHNEELTYIWKMPSRSAPKGLDELTVSRMVKLWTNYVKTGHPTPVKDQLLQNVTWPPVESPRNINYLKIDVDLSVRKNFREEHMRFWDNLYNEYGEKPFVTF